MGFESPFGKKSEKPELSREEQSKADTRRRNALGFTVAALGTAAVAGIAHESNKVDGVGDIAMEQSAKAPAEAAATPVTIERDENGMVKKTRIDLPASAQAGPVRIDPVNERAAPTRIDPVNNNPERVRIDPINNNPEKQRIDL